MAQILGFRIQNFKTLKDVTLGKLTNDYKKESLSRFTAILGKNGCGKSTLLDAFGFLSDCLRFGVEDACDMNDRGGFERLRSKGQCSGIQFEIYYKESKNERPITYQLTIDTNENGRAIVASEKLLQARKNQSKGRRFVFLQLQNGEGLAWTYNAEGEDENTILTQFDSLLKETKQHSSSETKDREVITSRNKQQLAIASLASLAQHPRIASFRQFMESWMLSYFIPDAARSIPKAGAQKRLNKHGDNLANVVQFMERENPKRFKTILKEIATKIPGLLEIKTEVQPDGRLGLKFLCEGFNEPLYQQSMSDGTMKVLAYLLLMADPNPASLLCIEEPENGLYPELLTLLASELRAYAEKDGPQIVITTHQPYLVDALAPEEVWLLEKGKDGFVSAKRASDIPIVQKMYEQGQPLGALWYSDYLEGVIS